MIKAKKIRFRYLDENLEPIEWMVENDLSELIQHEYDHLDGILSTERAIDSKSYKWKC